jgi:hypothetical protein
MKPFLLAGLALLERPLAPPRATENQVREFFGESLPEGARLWSKEGDTSEVRHDAAYVELPDGGEVNHRDPDSGRGR